ncbi:tetratricopeptide repeat protein [Pinirhizobacter sp.]|jgi:tetratricopeptide (TPR) repeat protein|uniref:tetratricopeptide repeat protein n=1 Tax=Pinirhizobacter sp. TaxID=2950432 RepID=UPI002F404757
MKKLLFAFCLAFAAIGPALADDSPKAVQAAIAQGNYPLAEQELRQAITEHPQSAKAHYVLAQVLAHQGNIGEASTEAGKAQSLDPKIGFTDPAKFQHFQAELRQATAPAPARAAPVRRDASGAAAPVPFQVEKSHTSIWPWVLGLVVIGGIVMVMRRRQSPPPGGAGYGYGQGPNTNVPPGFPGGGYPPQNQGSGMGGSFLGGLAGGALGAAAVNMYENHERREEAERDGSGNIAGGADTGDSRGQAYDDLRDQPIDMGNDDSGWGGGGGGDDSGFDSGGSDDSWT